MQGHEHYSRAPITEAIIDLRVAPAEGFVADKLSDMHPRIQNDFPVIQTFHARTGTFTFGPDASPQIATSEQHAGFLFRSRDNLHTLQATSGGFTFNRLAPYESWQAFSTEAKNLWKLYIEVCQPICVTRAAIRYVNQIHIPANDAVELKDYLRTLPEISPALPKKALQNFFMQLHIPQQDLDCTLIINEAIAPRTNPNIVTIILDLDLFREQIWTSDDDGIWLFLDRLSQRKNDVFESSITEKTRELIR